MESTDFESAIRLQFDCLMRKVIYRSVKNYNKEIGRRYKREISFSDLQTDVFVVANSAQMYFTHFSIFDVVGIKIYVSDEKLSKVIKRLSLRRQLILMMSYFFGMSDAQIADIFNMHRSSVYRNRMRTLILIRDMYEGG